MEEALGKSPELLFFNVRDNEIVRNGKRRSCVNVALLKNIWLNAKNGMNKS